MLNRFNGHVVPFADNATATNRTIFGDVTQSDDIDDNLNADFKIGWEIVGINDNPTKQDFNALAYTLGNLISYLYQQGIAVWNTNQKYYVGSRCIGSDGLVYKALTGTEPSPNTGNNPVGDATNWEWDLKNLVDKSTAQTIAGIKTFSSFPITPSSAPTTNYQVANKKYVDDNSISLSVANSYDIGVGQTWQNLTASRSAAVTYTNTTGKPIFVIARQLPSSNYSFAITVDGIERDRVTAQTALHNSICAIIPNGSTYSVSQLSGSWTWNELR